MCFVLELDMPPSCNSKLVFDVRFQHTLLIILGIIFHCISVELFITLVYPLYVYIRLEFSCFVVRYKCNMPNSLSPPLVKVCRFAIHFVNSVTDVNLKF